LDRLEVRLKALINEAKQSPESDSLKKIPSWIKEWESRWKGRTKGGELVSEGEEELYNLGIRVKEKFQDLFDEEYHPDVYSIRATQVSTDIAFPIYYNVYSCIHIL
jgi:multiple inositol-polyphosphate phosphatase / 2,3-bisphosphoglycerate 3-phosphatase